MSSDTITPSKGRRVWAVVKTLASFKVMIGAFFVYAVPGIILGLLHSPGWLIKGICITLVAIYYFIRLTDAWSTGEFMGRQVTEDGKIEKQRDATNRKLKGE